MSVSVFLVSKVVIDLESAYYLFVLLDGVMHADVMPLLPFVAGNPYQQPEHRRFHLLCMVAAFAGLTLLWVRATWVDREDAGRRHL